MRVGSTGRMETGLASGGEPHSYATLGVGAFIDDEGGYTTVAMAVALLVSISLVFSAASAQWVFSRAGEVQQVADAAAESGANAVAAYATIAQTLDACVLSMGLAGMVACGAGLVASCVPSLAVTGADLVTTGTQILGLLAKRGGGPAEARGGAPRDRGRQLRRVRLGEL